MTSDADAIKVFMKLVDAGFTSEELRGIAGDINFAVVMAEGMQESVTIDALKRVTWTPEKRAGWDKAVKEWLALTRPGDAPS
jgi:hypothetical protein